MIYQQCKDDFAMLSYFSILKKFIANHRLFFPLLIIQINVHLPAIVFPAPLSNLISLAPLLVLVFSSPEF
jgi:hypothetical protein